MMIKHVLLPALAVSLSAAGCSDQEPADPGSVQAEREAAQLFTWQAGTDGTHAFVSKTMALRCWPLGQSFDCLIAIISDSRAQSADAPVYRGYYRFIAPQLPKNREALEQAQLLDGYACSVMQQGGFRRMLEEVWKDGRVIEQTDKVPREYETTGWSPEDVAGYFSEHEILPHRPYLACAIVDELVQRSGLEVIDSPVFSYEAIMSADRGQRSIDTASVAATEPVEPLELPD